MLLVFASCGAKDGENYAPGDVMFDNNYSNGNIDGVDGGDYIKGEPTLPDVSYDAEAPAEEDCVESELPDQKEPIDSVPETIFIKENDFTKTADQPVSTFSADVDTASYTYFRKLVGQGYRLNELTATAGRNLRTEEMVN